MKCKLVANRESGNFEKLDIQALLGSLGCDAEVDFIDSRSDWSAEGFDTVIVCGGDGTLSRALGKCRGKKLVYVPCGTFNETAATSNSLCRLAQVNGKAFSYVCATGSFTEIGYSTENCAKKRKKGLAYILQITKNYRCHEIAARLNLDGKRIEGTFTLLMVLKSRQCFGFKFNKGYKTLQKPYLLAVKSVGKDCLQSRVKMFFPFFRIFFCGARPQEKTGWMLLPFDNLTMEIAPRDFCVDGEKKRLGGTLHFCETAVDPPIAVIDASRFQTPKGLFV